MVFAGCSFTWGQGLYFYHDMDKSNIPLNPHHYDESKLQSKDFLYKNTLRFPRLVANHFKTFDVVQDANGGTDDQSIYFIKELFNIENSTALTKSKFNFSDIDYVIIQLTQPHRSSFKFELENTTYNTMIMESDGITYNPYVKFDGNDWRYIKNEKKKFLEWLHQNNLSFEQGLNLASKQILERVKEIMIHLSKHNVKTKILAWTGHYEKLIQNDNFFKDKFIPISFDNKQFNCIDALFRYDETMMITYDSEKKIQVVDDHPSKKCHQIIAESIIKNIEMR